MNPRNSDSSIDGLGEVGSKPAVFFMVGCQRSGSNWLRTILSEREDLIAPHPPHIMRDFMPILSKFGNIDDIANLEVLVDHVCSFVERNQVTWYDKHNRPIKFDRKLITESVTITITELREKQVLDIQQHLQQKQALQKYIERSKLNKSPQWSKLLEAESANQQQNIDIKEQVIDEKYYLLAIFNEIMNTCAELNDKYTWMCKSMGMSQYHDMLFTMYGPERLRYIYLVRDPRDVTLSFMKTPVGDCHPYMIAKKWSRLQDYALRIKNINPELIHEVKYEDVIRDKVVEVAKINKFIGKRRTGKVMRRGSIVMIKSEAEMTNDSKHSNESVLAAKLSYQFKNLTRGDSFTEKQFQKWKNEMDEDDIHLVELVAKEQMERLGYECNSILDKNHDNHNFSEEEIKSFEDQNKILIKEMNDNLAIENPGDFKRRLIQAEVLTFEPGHLPDSFKEQKQIVLDKSTVIIDSEDEGKEKTEPELHDEKHDFRSWPKGADQFGYLSEQEIDFHVSPCHQVSVKKGRVISYAVASQCGYYPRERGKKNQDSYIAGLPINSTYTTIRKSKSDENRTRRVLFSVFDGHGRMGEECSTLSRDAITEDFSQRLELCKTKKNCKRNVQKALFDTYLNANDKLQQNESVNTSQSGTTAISLCIDRKYFHVANVGDSRCIVASSPRRQWKCRKSPASEEKLIVDVLSNDHTPDRLDEAERIKSHGGLVMTLEQYDNEGKDDSIPRGTDPLRIWSKNGKYPGVNFTRSIGDEIAKSLGVHSEPECSSHRITDQHEMFVLGSDGIFDFIPNEEAVQIADGCNDPAEACRALVGTAYSRWINSEERTDDITVIVGFFLKE